MKKINGTLLFIPLSLTLSLKGRGDWFSRE